MKGAKGKHGSRAERRRSRLRGPKSRAGKAAASGNSLKHGLAIPVPRDEFFAPEAEALARGIAGQTRDPSALAAARRIAEAQVDLQRLRLHRLGLIEQAGIATGTSDEGSSARERLAARIERILLGRLPEPCDRTLSRLAGLAEELAKLDRYERRALSRRKFAVRAFDALGDASGGAAEKSCDLRDEALTPAVPLPAEASARRGEVR